MADDAFGFRELCRRDVGHAGDRQHGGGGADQAGIRGGLARAFSPQLATSRRPRRRTSTRDGVSAIGCERLMRGPGGLERRRDRGAGIRSGRDEGLPAGHPGEMGDPGLERVLADQHRGDAQAGACHLLRVERPALAVGHDHARPSTFACAMTASKARPISVPPPVSLSAGDQRVARLTGGVADEMRRVSLNCHSRMPVARLLDGRARPPRAPSRATSNLDAAISRSPAARSLIEPEWSNSRSMSRPASIFGARLDRPA